ncbi:MAG: glycosyltransferase [Methylobacteriaceae bacterium]|nr:glycosyltransferase [Methylobacteriaceae bacterium]
MKIVIFGLTISSSWGNGHATLWRGLQRALARDGWHVVFFERDVPYYAENRDLGELPGGELVLYGDWERVRSCAIAEVADADAAIVSSYCPDGIAATEVVLASPSALRVFYDLDTPVTLAQLRRGDGTTYIGPRGLSDFDLVLSYTGGAALDELRTRLGARKAVPLYGHVDPQTHRPVPGLTEFRADLSYIGTYAEDRQASLERLFIEPARRRPDLRFVIAGAQYPPDFPWTSNIFFVRHLPPPQHPQFYGSSRLTLNVTRQAMAEMGWCPSGRLFEAAACGATIVSDWWPGIDAFFTPTREIIVVEDTEDVLAALDRSAPELRDVGVNARRRALAEHTSQHRAAQFAAFLSNTPRSGQRAAAPIPEPEGV